MHYKNRCSLKSGLKNLENAYQKFENEYIISQGWVGIYYSDLRAVICESNLSLVAIFHLL